MDQENGELEKVKELISKVNNGTATDKEADAVSEYLDTAEMVVDSLSEASQEVI